MEFEPSSSVGVPDEQWDRARPPGQSEAARPVRTPDGPRNTGGWGDSNHVSLTQVDNAA